MYQQREHLPARSNDPLTSWEAAEHIVGSGKAAFQEHRAVAAVRAYPRMTSLELSEAARICRFELARRLPEAERHGLVIRGPVRTCRISKRKAATWHCEPVQLELVP